MLQVHAPILKEDPYEPRELEHIANIRLLTYFKTSLFGDQRLFFRHLNIAGDRLLWPTAWRLMREDLTQSKDDPDNVWGNEVPAGVWPDNDVDAEAFFLEQQ